MPLHKGKNANPVASMEGVLADAHRGPSLGSSTNAPVDPKVTAGQQNEPGFSGPYDRSELAEFMIENGPRIRRRVRGKLGEMLRRTVDSEDILATVIRRLDRFAASGRLRAVSENELWALVTKITDAALADKVRTKQRQDPLKMRMVLTGEPASRSGPETSFRNDPPYACIAAHGIVEDIESKNKSDAEIALLWARGLSHSAIAASLNQEVNEVRSRWQLIKRYLRRQKGMR